MRSGGLETGTEDLYGGIGFNTPDDTSDGNLPKHWEPLGTERVLLKSGGPLNQEPYNEVIATMLHQDQLAEGSFFRCFLVNRGERAWSSCPSFLRDDEEFIPAIYVLGHVAPAEGNDFERYVAGCASLGCPDVKGYLWRMMVCDDILAISDRHFRNFGLVRNVETPEVRSAPIFDTGTSLWCDAPLEQLMRHDFMFESKQFHQSPARQMLLVDDFSWLREDALRSIASRAVEVLGQNPLLGPRAELVGEGIAWRVERMLRIAGMD